MAHRQRPDHLYDRSPPAAGSYADPMFSFPNVASTCELVFEWLDALNALEKSMRMQPKPLHRYGDGHRLVPFSFRRPKTLEIAAELMRRAPDRIRSMNRLRQQQESRLRLLALSERHASAKRSARGFYVFGRDHPDPAVFKGDTEGFVNQGLSIKGIDLSLFAMEREDDGRSRCVLGVILVSAMVGTLQWRRTHQRGRREVKSPAEAIKENLEHLEQVRLLPHLLDRCIFFVCHSLFFLRAATRGGFRPVGTAKAQRFTGTAADRATKKLFNDGRESWRLFLQIRVGKPFDWHRIALRALHFKSRQSSQKRQWVRMHWTHKLLMAHL